MPPFPKLQRDRRVDVAIVGGGMTGLTAAYLLTAAGKSVASDIVSVAQNVGAPRPSSGTTGATGTGMTSTPPTATAPAQPLPNKEASSPARDVKQPGSGEERL